MKTRQYLLIGTMLMGLGMPAMAQDNKTIINEVTNIIKGKPADLDAQMKQIYKQNKKNADVLCGIGRAFYDMKDSVNAKIYAEYALKANKEYGPAYTLLGDLAARADDGNGAIQNYQQAIYFSPKEPEAYYKYATAYRKLNPQEAISKLEELREQRPDIAVDALIGRIHYSSNNFDEAINSFEKVNLNAMEESDLTNYAMSLWFTQKYQKSLEVVQAGLKKMPRDAAFNRLAMFNCTDLKDYDNALVYADALFNKSDSAKFSYFDYTYYGNALSGAKKHTEAIDMYKKALEQEFDDKTKRAGVIKQLAEGYKQNDDYENAIKTYQEFLKTAEKPSPTDITGLAQLYTQYANTMEGDARMEMFKKAENVYDELEKAYPDALEFATMWKARVNSYMDPETKDGLAKPFYEKLASIIEPRAEKDKADNARLVECYRYLGYYNLLNNDKETSISYWSKILEIDPENQQAKQAIEALTKK